jgi:WXXGXW repeat (2 copies)
MKLRSFVLAGFLFVTLPLASSFAQVGVSINIAPPVLPVVEQPPCPVAGYIWTPGYWGYGVGDYYWVPGAWVAPPSVGLLWTPPWWGFNNGAYAFNEGYWGPSVGFYGGINYGYGYSGNGYWGGRWEGNAFRYNTAVTRVNTNVVHNTYIDRSVNKQVNANRTSFNGPNGVKAEPTAEQKAAAANARKMPATSQQLARQQAAAKDRNLQASVNKGKPNADAIKTFNKNEGVGQGKGAGAEGAGAAGGAGAGKGENRIGNASELNRQGEGAGAGKGGKGPGTETGAGKGGNKPGSVTERHAQGAGGPGERGGNKVGAENHGNRNVGGNQAKAHSGKMAGPGGGAAHGPRQMTPRSGQPKTAAHDPQMGARNAQMGGGNRPAPKGQQQQRKKTPGER